MIPLPKHIFNPVMGVVDTVGLLDSTEIFLYVSIGKNFKSGTITRVLQQARQDSTDLQIRSN